MFMFVAVFFQIKTCFFLIVHVQKKQIIEESMEFGLMQKHQSTTNQQCFF